MEPAYQRTILKWTSQALDWNGWPIGTAIETNDMKINLPLPRHRIHELKKLPQPRIPIFLGATKTRRNCEKSKGTKSWDMMSTLILWKCKSFIRMKLNFFIPFLKNELLCINAFSLFVLGYNMKWSIFDTE